MILAFATIGGFLYWLNGQASREMAERQAFADSVAAAEEEERNRPPLVDPERIQMDASGFQDRAIRLESLPVASTLGTQGYWLEMPNGNPFLVSIGSDAEVEGTVEPGVSVDVTGTVLAMNDSVLTVWTESESIGEGDRLAAEFATHFIEVLELSVVPGGGSGNDEGSEGSGDSGGE
ncbi:MAG: hypothetical protein WD101_04445 [Gemmatimonadota bacterium]